MSSRRYRVLYVQISPGGGSTTGLLELVRGLDKSVYEPIVLFYAPNYYCDQFEACGAKTITLSDEPLRPSRNVRDIGKSLSRVGSRIGDAYRVAKQLYVLAKREWPIVRRVKRVIRDERVDLVHHNNYLRANRATIIAARRAKVPQVSHVRMLEGFGPIDLRVSKYVDSFVYMSTAIETFYQQLGIPPNQGQVIYDAFDGSDYDRVTDREVAKVRAEFSVGDRDCLITNVGRLDFWKGHDFFIEALSRVVPSAPGTKALIVGETEPSSRNQAYYRKVLQLVKDLGLSDNVVFTGNRDDVPQLMTASDLIVHSSSEAEPFGRVVVEGMMAARPVVATAAGGPLDILQDRVTGLLVPIKNAELMAEAIDWVVKNPEEAKAMGQRAGEDARVRFSVEQHMRGIHELYERIL